MSKELIFKELVELIAIELIDNKGSLEKILKLINDYEVDEDA